MKRVIILALVSVMVVLAFAGCKDESKPHFTRMSVTPSCGVVPLQVDGYAIASGGDESGSPTGGNNNLEINWNFGDAGSSYSSIAYHQYLEAGEYTVVVTGTDNSGNVTTASEIVTVLADTLVIDAFLIGQPDLMLTTADSVKVDVRAAACYVDPDIPEDYRKLEFEWFFVDVDSTYSFFGQNPIWNFPLPGTYEVISRVSLTFLAVTRFDTLSVTVVEP